MLYIRKTLLLGLAPMLFLFSGTAFAQDVTDQPTDWTLLEQQNGVKISYKYSDCTFHKFNWRQGWYLLRIENTKSDPVTISWDEEMWFNNVCKTCNVDEYHKTITIGANETKSGQCDLEHNRELTIFVRFNDKPNTETLTGFSLANLAVTR